MSAILTIDRTIAILGDSVEKATETEYATEFNDFIIAIKVVDDIDDSIRAGILTENDIPKHLRDVLGEGVSIRISNMIENVYRNSADGNIRMSDEFSAAFYELHDYLYRTVYKGSAAKAEEGKAEDMIEILFHYLCNHPERIPDEYRPVMREEGIKRAAADYIACMSDTYAVQLYKDLFIPRGWDGNGILH